LRDKCLANVIEEALNLFTTTTGGEQPTVTERAEKSTPACDPLDLEIIERAHEAAWARVETDIFRDTAKDDERKTALREWAFVLAGAVGFDTLTEKLETIIPNPGLQHRSRKFTARPHKLARSWKWRRKPCPGCSRLSRLWRSS
jgi:hypothetical protein